MSSTLSDQHLSTSIEYEENYFIERNDYVARREEFLPLFRVLVDQFEPRVKPSGKLLDIGCGAGFLLEVANQRGFTVSGCDVSEWACSHCQALGYDARVGLLEDIDYQDNYFDVAVCNHTLEHVPSPVSFLEEIYRILRPDGILVVGVPNFDSLISKVMREKWGSLLPEQHLWHFTPMTLKRMVQRCGFTPVQLEYISSTHIHPNLLKRITLEMLRKAGSAIRKDESMTLISRSNKKLGDT